MAATDNEYLCHVVQEPYHPFGAGNRDDGEPRMFVILELLCPKEELERACQQIIRNGRVRIRPIIAPKASRR